jgi:dihydrofolate reductase
MEGEGMGRIVVTEFVSLDGVVEDPGGVEGFEHGGWTTTMGAEGERWKLEETLASEAQLLGRRTFEVFADSWPSRKGEFADKFNSMPKYVVSSTLKDPEWANTTVLSGDPAQEVARLRDEEDLHLIVPGSAQLAQALIKAGLVDELRLMVFPVVLGTGKKLFGDTDDAKRLKLKESAAVGDGVLTLVYEKA